MAKRELINGRKYTLFIDYDRDQLKEYPKDWVEWLRQRILFILIDPIDAMLKKRTWRKLNNKNHTITLGVATLICCGIEALGGFLINKKSGENFKGFVEKYMNHQYKKEPKYLFVLRKHFRCGLAHDFCITEGGIHWGNKYFKKDKKLGLLISLPRLFDDFEKAFLRYVQDLKLAKEKLLINNFNRRFNEVFIRKQQDRF